MVSLEAATGREAVMRLWFRLFGCVLGGRQCLTCQIKYGIRSSVTPHYLVVTEGTLKKNLNDPPTSPRPPKPRAQVAPR